MDIFQIDPTLNAKLGHDLNADLKAYQVRAQDIGPKDAFITAYQAILAGDQGDLETGKVLVGTTLAVNAATQVQRDLHDAMAEANLLGSDADAVLAANVGPTGAGAWWNWSLQNWGIVQGVAPDPALQLGTVIDPSGNVVSGVLAPAQ